EHLMLLERLRDRVLDHLAQSGLVQAGTEGADARHDAGDGIGAVVRAAACAARPTVLVAVGDLPGVPASGARLGRSSPAAVARRADPQFAVALHEPPGLAAVPAAGQDQPLGAERLQRPDQQLDLRRAFRAAGGEQAGIAGSGGSPLWPAALFFAFPAAWAAGSIRSSIRQPRMSSSAMKIFRLSRSG